MEEQIQKFYKTKKHQRDENYARLSKEILNAIPREDPSNPFFKKHVGLARLVNKKVLNAFTDRENRIASKQGSASTQNLHQQTSQTSLLREQAESQQHNNSNLSDIPSRPSTMGCNGKSSSVSRMSQMRLKADRSITNAPDEASERRALTPKNSHCVKNSQNVIQNISIDKTPRTISAKANFKSEKENILISAIPRAEEHSLLLRWDSEGRFGGDNTNDRVVTSFEEHVLGIVEKHQKDTPRTVDGPTRDTIDRSSVDIRSQRNRSHEMGPGRDSRPPLANKQVVSMNIQRAQTSQSHISPAGGHKGRIRMTTNLQVADPLNAYFRLSKNENAWSSFLANVEVPDAQKNDDVEQFRFVFDENEEIRRRKLSQKNRTIIKTASRESLGSPLRANRGFDKENIFKDSNANKSHDLIMKNRFSSLESRDSGNCSTSFTNINNLKNGPKALEIPQKPNDAAKKNELSSITTNSTATATNASSKETILKTPGNLTTINSLHRRKPPTASRERARIHFENSAVDTSCDQHGVKEKYFLPKFHNSFTIKSIGDGKSASSLVLDNRP